MSTRTTRLHSSRQNTISEEHGVGIRALVDERRQSLDMRLAELQGSERQGSEAAIAIESSLAMLDQLLPSGAEITPVVAEQLVRWLEANKNLGVIDAKSIRVVH